MGGFARRPGRASASSAPVRDRARRSARLLPSAVRRMLGVANPNYPPGTVRWGSLRRTTPFSRSWGYERSTPIDRVCIEDFLTRHAEDVQGACLEILNANYTNQFGAARVTSVDILDIDPANTAATIVADLGERDSLLRSGSTASSSRRRYT